MQHRNAALHRSSRQQRDGQKSDVGNHLAPMSSNERPATRDQHPVILYDGQCGLCRHFGEHDPDQTKQLVQIRNSHQAPETFTEECGHPTHEQLHLLVTANSACEGYEPAVA